MRSHTIVALLFAVVIICVNGKPLDDDSTVTESDDTKKDTIDKPSEDQTDANKPAEDTAAVVDNPITDPTADKPDESVTSEDAQKRQMPTATTTTTTEMPSTDTTEKVTKGGLAKQETTPAPTQPTTPDKSTTEEPVTKPVPDGDKPSVEGSDNNTLTMKGTTFHAAIEDESVQFYEDMNKNMHDIHRHTFQTMIGSVYKDDPEFKQVVIIKFSPVGKKSEKSTEGNAQRADVESPGVVVDFYLRFYNPGNHLKKLTEAIQTGQLQTHKVKPTFIRAYVAEPTGRVCTPDCKVQCYSYCDAGCCHINIVQTMEMPTASPVEDFISQQEHMLKTGIVPPKPEECQGAMCEQQQPQMMMTMMQPQMQSQMPCQGASCAPMMQPQMPCQGPSCAPMMMPPPPMPCQGPSCAPMMPMMQPQMPCQGASCAPMMPPQMPCQGPSCAPMMMPPPPMPCQGASCAPMMPPPQMPMMQPQMPGCAPSCQQICAPTCPSSCCGMQQQVPMMQPMAQPMPQMYAPPARCGPKGC